MKKIYLSFFLIAGLSTITNAQIADTTAYLDVNLINAAHMTHGDMWRNIKTSAAACEYPKGTGKHANYQGGIWMTGKTAGSDELHVSATLFRLKGIEYWPGPLNTGGAIDSATSKRWTRIWKVNRSEIAAFRASHGAVVTDVIREWPSKGNINAKGYAGAPLTISTDMAPFIDVNGDGIYNHKDGDYPDMKGDQMLWWVFNDNGPVHPESTGKPLKIEIHAAAYAYNRGTAADRILFYEYTLHNRSADQYNDFRFALHSDADLGNPFDDFIAFDSVHRMGIEYNMSIDAPYGGNSYGAHPPITGISFIETPGDTYPSGMIPAGAFSWFEGTGGTPEYREPNSGPSFDNYMHGLTYSGKPHMYGTFNFPISEGAVQCDSHAPLADRRFILTSGASSFKAGTSVKVAMAFLVTDTTGNGCPGVDFSDITSLADTAWDIYYHPLPLSSPEVMVAHSVLSLYPNPVTSVLHVSAGSPITSAHIVDATGRTIKIPYSSQGNELQFDLTALASGVYALICSDGSSTTSRTFVKQ